MRKTLPFLPSCCDSFVAADVVVGAVTSDAVAAVAGVLVFTTPLGLRGLSFAEFLRSTWVTDSEAGCPPVAWL